MVTAVQLGIKKACSVARQMLDITSSTGRGWFVPSCARTASHAYAASDLLWLPSLAPAATATAKDKGPIKDKDA